MEANARLNQVCSQRSQAECLLRPKTTLDTLYQVACSTKILSKHLALPPIAQSGFFEKSLSRPGELFLRLRLHEHEENVGACLTNAVFKPCDDSLDLGYAKRIVELETKQNGDLVGRELHGNQVVRADDARRRPCE